MSRSRMYVLTPRRSLMMVLSHWALEKSCWISVGEKNRLSQTQSPPGASPPLPSGPRCPPSYGDRKQAEKDLPECRQPGLGLGRREGKQRARSEAHVKAPPPKDFLAPAVGRADPTPPTAQGDPRGARVRGTGRGGWGGG